MRTAESVYIFEDQRAFAFRIKTVRRLGNRHFEKRSKLPFRKERTEKLLRERPRV